jgi:imidazolonepropionase-like amidohydrolase
LSFVLFFSNIKVACRIRPMTEEEILQGATIIAHKVADDNVSFF